MLKSLSVQIARHLFLFLLSLLFSSCALNYFYTYQQSDAGTGIAIFKPIVPTSSSYISLNDTLIVESKFVKSITFENLPVGKYELRYMSSNFSYKEKLDQKISFEVRQGEVFNKVISIPPLSTGYWVYNGIMLAGLYTYLFLQYNH